MSFHFNDLIKHMSGEGIIEDTLTLMKSREPSIRETRDLEEKLSLMDEPDLEELETRVKKLKDIEEKSIGVKEDKRTKAYKEKKRLEDEISKNREMVEERERIKRKIIRREPKIKEYDIAKEKLKHDLANTLKNKIMAKVITKKKIKENKEEEKREIIDRLVKSVARGDRVLIKNRRSNTPSWMEIAETNALKNVSSLYNLRVAEKRIIEDQPIESDKLLTVKNMEDKINKFIEPYLYSKTGANKYVRMLVDYSKNKFDWKRMGNLTEGEISLLSKQGAFFELLILGPLRYLVYMTTGNIGHINSNEFNKRISPNRRSGVVFDLYQEEADIECKAWLKMVYEVNGEKTNIKIQQKKIEGSENWFIPFYCNYGGERKLFNIWDEERKDWIYEDFMKDAFYLFLLGDGFYSYKINDDKSLKSYGKKDWIIGEDTYKIYRLKPEKYEYGIVYDNGVDELFYYADKSQIKKIL